jgi:serine protease Do
MTEFHVILCKSLWATTIFAGMAWLGASSAVADDGANKSELIHRLLPTVVNISVRKEEVASPATPAEGAGSPASDASPGIKDYVGSGFVIDPSGLIVTNYHVVENAFEITVTFSDGKRLPGTVLQASRLADLAVVKVATDHALATAHWGNSDLLKVGDQVIAAGNPYGIGLSVSTGIVSGLNRDIQNSPIDEFIQTDASINHGNSGGPLFDMQGNVVGVDSAIISPTAGSVGLGFAESSNVAHFVVDQLLTYGWIRPSWIGLYLQQVTPEIAEAIGMKEPAGAIVGWLVPHGPAAKAGIVIGDVILRCNDRAPSDERALFRAISHTPVGDTLTLAVQHNGDERSVAITTEAWPRAEYDSEDAPTKVQRPMITIPPDLGLSLSVVANADREKLGLVNGVDGVLVTNVAANSDPARRGVLSGDVILRVRDKPVANPAEVQSEIEAARATKRDFVLMLIYRKGRDVFGPKWVTLRLGQAGG